MAQLLPIALLAILADALNNSYGMVAGDHHRGHARGRIHRAAKSPF